MLFLPLRLGILDLSFQVDNIQEDHEQLVCITFYSINIDNIKSQNLFHSSC
jgi:hypothetical protein